jgi:hypothetical protein
MHGGGSVDFFWRPLACAVIHAASTTPHQGEWHSKRRTSAPRRCWGTRRRVAMGATSRQYAASRKAVAQMANGIFFGIGTFRLRIAYCSHVLFCLLFRLSPDGQSSPGWWCSSAHVPCAFPIPVVAPEVTAYGCTSLAWTLRCA